MRIVCFQHQEFIYIKRLQKIGVSYGWTEYKELDTIKVGAN